MFANVKVPVELLALGLLGWSGAVAASPTFTASGFLRGQYDDNVYLQDEAPLAPGQSVAALPANAGDFLADLGLSLGWLMHEGPALRLEASYSPELFRYSQYTTENHTDHRFMLEATGTSSGWQYEAKASWQSTMGDHESPVFNRLGGAPPVGSEPVRARRAQDITKLKGKMTHDFSRGFVRGVLALGDQDFHTAERALPGYANYVDRGEWTVGPELGWKIPHRLSLVAAVRVGRQHQADLLGLPLNSSSNLMRGLLGLEGQPAPGLKFGFLAGPDVRRFGSAVRPGFDRHQTTFYGETNATWSPTKTDSFVLSGRRYLWISSGGRTAYIDGMYDLSWKHQLAQVWNFTTALNVHTADSRGYNPAAPRDDVIRAINLMLGRALGAQARLELGFALDWSRSGLPATPGREYHRRQYSLGYFHRW